ncbi:hypothetical protein NMG60_11024558 [Bertholletia excelsa]
MLAIEDVLCELNEDINEQGLPPGFRFHPTDEELITFYLASKVFNGSFCGVDIAEVDLNRCEPWDLPDVAKMGEREWYFFSLRDRKYPTGLRTNRATSAGYWKATGKDREVYSAANGALLGMKKTLVFYRGRAPRGEKTRWVMHEYRLDGDFSYRHTCKEEWVICRIFHKVGEKKSPLFQGQSYSLPALLEAANTGVTTALESQSQDPIIQNPFLIHHHFQDSDLKSLINHDFTIAGLQLQASFSPITTTTAPNNDNNDTNTNGPSPSPPTTTSFFRSLHPSHQGCALKEQAQATPVPKQCKTESSFYSPLFQQQLLPDAILRGVDRAHHGPNMANPLFLGMDTVSDMPTGFQFHALVDPPSVRSATGESWALDL